MLALKIQLSPIAFMEMCQKIRKKNTETIEEEDEREEGEAKEPFCA